MTIWKGSTVTTYYGSKDSLDTGHCVVSVEDGHITVAYDYHDGEQLVAEVYEGTEIGSGHFKLKSRDGRGEASLHCFPNGRILNGWWREDSQEGMWRIRLAD